MGQLGPRRNTVPSLLIVPPEDPDGSNLDLSQTQYPLQRPDTAVRRATPSPLQFKRRSRSADDLADMLHPPQKSSERRDRTEEIAFWRNSIVIDPLPTLPDSQEDTPQQTIESMLRSETLEAKPRPSLEPVQDFDFGLGDKSCDARPGTLLERVNTLEVKLFDFEFALSRLQGTDIANPNLPRKSSGQRSLRDTQPTPGDSSRHGSSSTNDTSHRSSPSERWQPASPRELRPDRASKATTIKPTHRRVPSSRSQTSSPSSVRLTREQYDALYGLIQDEKLARQHLETQVIDLQKEVEILKSPVYAYVRPIEYPTPSPDSFHDPATMSTPRMLHRSPRMRPERNLNETSRFSMTETDPETETDDPYPEVYETPQENKFRFESNRASPPGMI